MATGLSVDLVRFGVESLWDEQGAPPAGSGYFLGFDTSCYTTSLGLVDTGGKIVKDLRRILTVKPGEKGLRQSEALFQHLKNLPDLVEAAALFRPLWALPMPPARDRLMDHTCRCFWPVPAPGRWRPLPKFRCWPLHTRKGISGRRSLVRGYAAGSSWALSFRRDDRTLVSGARRPVWVELLGERLICMPAKWSTGSGWPWFTVSGRAAP